MTSKTRLSILLVSTPILAFVIVGGLIGQERPSGDRVFRHLRVFDDVVQLVMSNYVEDVKVDRAMEGALKGLADGLDPDSAYLDAKQVKSVSSGEALPDGDVGLELTRQYLPAGDRRARRLARGEGRAADRRLRPWDRHQADPRHVGVRGCAPAARCAGNEGDAHGHSRQRRRSARRGPGAREGGGRGGHLTVDRHGRRLPARRHVQERLGRGDQEADGRPGEVRGEVAADRSAADGGRSASTTASPPRGCSSSPERWWSRPAATKRIATPWRRAPTRRSIDLPVTLLVTTGTSGAAELFVAALDGNGRADVVGERTLGRAGIQKLVQLPENRGLWLTYAKYLTPKGDPIHGKGIEPDVRVEEPDVEFGDASARKGRDARHGASITSARKPPDSQRPGLTTRALLCSSCAVAAPGLQIAASHDDHH